MHGVGSQWVKRAFEVSGHNPFISVLSQSEPDPEFRTVDFPNPEEKGVRKNKFEFCCLTKYAWLHCIVFIVDLSLLLWVFLKFN